MKFEHRAVRAYRAAKQRCNNKNSTRYKNYGGRGIKCLMTKEDFKELWVRDKADKMKRPSIDRINNDGNYEYSNCRFIELSENTARTNNAKKFCPRGHKYSGKNLYTKTTNGYRNRECRICRFYARRKLRGCVLFRKSIVKPSHEKGK